MEKEKFIQYNQCSHCKYFKMTKIIKELELECCGIIEFVMKRDGLISNIDICPIEAMKILKED